MFDQATFVTVGRELADSLRRELTFSSSTELLPSDVRSLPLRRPLHLEEELGHGVRRGSRSLQWLARRRGGDQGAQAKERPHEVLGMVSALLEAANLIANIPPHLRLM